MKLAILGGGGFRVPLVLRALMRDLDSPITEVVLYDRDPLRLAAIAQVVKQEAVQQASVQQASVQQEGAVQTPGELLAGEQAGRDLAVRTTTAAEEAVGGADFIFSAIRVGDLGARVADERVAINHGVLGQETVGAGGIAFGLRTIPVAMNLARLIQRETPTAWVINFTNPAGMVTEAMSHVLGNRVIGICDSPLGLARRVARALGRQVEDCRIDYSGLNHLGWLQGLHAADGDLLPDFLADESAILGTEEGEIFGADWLRTLGAVPNEYLHYHYLHRDALAEQRGVGYRTRGEFLQGQQGSFFEAVTATPESALAQWEGVLAERNSTYMAAARGAGHERHDEDVVSGGYEGVALAVMRALAGGGPAELILNVRAGERLGLPADAVVELPCRVEAGSVTPRPTTPLALHMAGLVAQVKAVERLTIEAAATGSARTAEAAFAVHPLIDSVALAPALLRDYRRAIPELDRVFTRG